LYFIRSDLDSHLVRYLIKSNGEPVVL